MMKEDLREWQRWGALKAQLITLSKNMSSCV
jgi:hypothetical protein